MNEPLTVKEIADLAKEFKPTSEQVKAMWERVHVYTEELKIQETLRAPTQEFLDRTYNI